MLSAPTYLESAVDCCDLRSIETLEELAGGIKSAHDRKDEKTLHKLCCALMMQFKGHHPGAFDRLVDAAPRAEWVDQRHDFTGSYIRLKKLVPKEIAMRIVSYGAELPLERMLRRPEHSELSSEHIHGNALVTKISLALKQDFGVGNQEFAEEAALHGRFDVLRDLRFKLTERFVRNLMTCADDIEMRLDKGRIWNESPLGFGKLRIRHATLACDHLKIALETLLSDDCEKLALVVAGQRPDTFGDSKINPREAYLRELIPEFFKRGWMDMLHRLLPIPDEMFREPCPTGMMALGHPGLRAWASHIQLDRCGSVNLKAVLMSSDLMRFREAVHSGGPCDDELMCVAIHNNNLDAFHILARHWRHNIPKALASIVRLNRVDFFASYLSHVQTDLIDTREVKNMVKLDRVEMLELLFEKLGRPVMEQHILESSHVGEAPRCLSLLSEKYASLFIENDCHAALARLKLTSGGMEKLDVRKISPECMEVLLRACFQPRFLLVENPAAAHLAHVCCLRNSFFTCKCHATHLNASLTHIRCGDSWIPRNQLKLTCPWQISEIKTNLTVEQINEFNSHQSLNSKNLDQALSVLVAARALNRRDVARRARLRLAVLIKAEAETAKAETLKAYDDLLDVYEGEEKAALMTVGIFSPWKVAPDSPKAHSKAFWNLYELMPADEEMLPALDLIQAPKPALEKLLSRCILTGRRSVADKLIGRNLDPAKFARQITHVKGEMTLKAKRELDHVKARMWVDWKPGVKASRVWMKEAARSGLRALGLEIMKTHPSLAHIHTAAEAGWGECVWEGIKNMRRELPNYVYLTREVCERLKDEKVQNRMLKVALSAWYGNPACELAGESREELDLAAQIYFLRGDIKMLAQLKFYAPLDNLSLRQRSPEALLLWWRNLCRCGPIPLNSKSLLEEMIYTNSPLFERLLSVYPSAWNPSLRKMLRRLKRHDMLVLVDRLAQ